MKMLDRLLNIDGFIKRPIHRILIRRFGGAGAALLKYNRRVDKMITAVEHRKRCAEPYTAVLCGPAEIKGYFIQLSYFPVRHFSKEYQCLVV